MTSKARFEESFKALNYNRKFQIREFPSFSFGTYDDCKEMFIEAFTFCDRTIVEFKWQPAYREVVGWMTDTKGKGLFLVGEVGLGKSNIIEKVIPLLFYHRFKKVIKVVHVNQLGHSLNVMLQAKFICVDEVGIEKLHNDYGIKSVPFIELIDNAERHSNLVFISTNLSKNEILERYGVRTLDRMLRLSKLITFKGKSLRR